MQLLSCVVCLVLLVSCGARSELEVLVASERDASELPDSGDLGDAGTAHQCLLLGADIDGPISTTWLWNGSAWTELSPATAPNARVNAAAATLGGTVVVFGGYAVVPNGSTYVNDTWIWDGTTWTFKSLAQGPTARDSTAVATLNGKVVLFGGENPSATAPFGDTWEWDGTSWTELHPPVSPLPRLGAVAATLNGKVVLFGGSVGALGGAEEVNDTWEWDGTTWTQMSPAVSPSPRSNAVVSTLGDAVVLFGGRSVNMDLSPAWLGDTWKWDGTAWTELTPPMSPSARGFAVSGALASTMMLAGGYTNIMPDSDDVWVWDGTTWTQSFAKATTGLEFESASMSCY